jgi:hypothetical protein
LHVDGSTRNKLWVDIPSNTGLTGGNIAEGQDSTRRVRTVPTGTHHWFLCDECMLVGSHSEAIVYAAMIHGGARSTPGGPLQLGIGLYLRMTPKEARNYWQIGEDAMLGYRRVRIYIYRLFKLKPYVMERRSSFVEQLLDIIENGRERWPGIARNGVINKYVENVLQTLFAQIHTPGLTAVMRHWRRSSWTSLVLCSFGTRWMQRWASGAVGMMVEPRSESWRRGHSHRQHRTTRSREQRRRSASPVLRQRIALVEPNAASRMPSRQPIVTNRSFERACGLARARSVRTHSDTAGDYGLTQWRQFPGGKGCQAVLPTTWR